MTVPRCVSLAPPIGTQNARYDLLTSPPQDPLGDYDRQDVEDFFNTTGTGWLRTFADWFAIEDNGSGTRTLNYWLVQELDDVIASAKGTQWAQSEDGRPITNPANVGTSKRSVRVLLNTRRYPYWANGTVPIVQDPSSVPAQFAMFDQRAYAPKSSAKNAPWGFSGGAKGLEFRFPGQAVVSGAYSDTADVAVGSDWYFWIKFLLARYNPNPSIGMAPALPTATGNPVVDQPRFDAYDNAVAAFIAAFGPYAFYLLPTFAQATPTCSSGSPTAVTRGSGDDQNQDGYVCELGGVQTSDDTLTVPAGYTLTRVYPNTAGDMSNLGYVGVKPALLGPPPPGAVIDIFEPVNEPNLEIWPQRQKLSKLPTKTGSKYTGPLASADHPGTLIIHQVVAEMFATAKQAVADIVSLPITIGGPGAPIALLGPACADYMPPVKYTVKNKRITARSKPYGKSSRVLTSVDYMTDKLLSQLHTNRFTAGPGFGWSHHFYTDAEQPREKPPFIDPKYGPTQASSTTSPRQSNSAALVRAMLVQHKWDGTRDLSGPLLYLTEGGCRLDQRAIHDGQGQHSAFAENRQATRLARSYHQMNNQPPTGQKYKLGDGIALYTNFLFYSEPKNGKRKTVNDSGLCISPSEATRPADNPDNNIVTSSNYGAVERPVYKTWKSLPT